MRRILVVGLTGPSGSGKSTAAGFFKENGFEVIDADSVARRVIDSDKHCIAELAKAFGEEILNADGSLNREELTQRAFKHPRLTKKLNDITHPVILDEVKAMINSLAAREVRAVVIDAALLFESGADALCDYVVTVIASDAIKLDRIVNRDGISVETAKARLKAQSDQSLYVNKANYAIINDEDIEKLRKRINIVTQLILEDADEGRI